MLTKLRCYWLETNILTDLPLTVCGEVESFLQIIKSEYTSEYRLQFLQLVNGILAELEDPDNYYYAYEEVDELRQKVTVIGSFNTVVEVSSEQESGRSRADNLKWNLRQLLGMLNLPYRKIEVTKRPTAGGVIFKVSFYREYTR